MFFFRFFFLCVFLSFSLCVYVSSLFIFIRYALRKYMQSHFVAFNRQRVCYVTRTLGRASNRARAPPPIMQHDPDLAMCVRLIYPPHLIVYDEHFDAIMVNFVGNFQFYVHTEHRMLNPAKQSNIIIGLNLHIRDVRWCA